MALGGVLFCGGRVLGEYLYRDECRGGTPAKTLGLSLQPTLIALADEVIE
jgi:hypothetical protein